jgi:hypothetical protein
VDADRDEGRNPKDQGVDNQGEEPERQQVERQREEQQDWAQKRVQDAENEREENSRQKLGIALPFEPDLFPEDDARQHDGQGRNQEPKEEPLHARAESNSPIAAPTAP